MFHLEHGQLHKANRTLFVYIVDELPKVSSDDLYRLFTTVSFSRRSTYSYDLDCKVISHDRYLPFIPLREYPLFISVKRRCCLVKVLIGEKIGWTFFHDFNQVELLK
jgi:hypothetical protein